MSRILNYPETDVLEDNDVFILDGDDGTRIISAENVSKEIAEKSGLNDEIAELKDDLNQIEPGLSDEAKTALLACFEHVVWADARGREYYNALEDALNDDGYPRIRARVDTGGEKIFTASDLSFVKKYLTVTYYQDSDDDGTILLTPLATTGTNLYINLSGETADINNPDSSSSGLNYTVVECNDGDVFVINGRGNGGWARLWGFVASDGTILSVADASLKYVENLELTPPANAKYLVLNYLGVSTSYNNKNGITLQGNLNNPVNVITAFYGNLSSPFTVNATFYTRWSTNPPDSTYGRIFTRTNTAISENGTPPQGPLANTTNDRLAVFTDNNYSDYRIPWYSTEQQGLYALKLPPKTTGFVADFSNSSGTCLYVFKKDANGDYQIVRDGGYVRWYTNQELITGLDPNSDYIICGSSKYNNNDFGVTIEVTINGSV